MDTDEEALAALTERMAELGAPEPGAWASSEITEDIPQRARYLVLRRIWAEALSPWRNPGTLRRNDPAARLLAQGADPDLLAQALRGVVFDTVTALIGVIDDGYDPGAPSGAPGWALAETREGANLTGRILGGLHEDLLSTDPAETEADDFW